MVPGCGQAGSAGLPSVSTVGSSVRAVRGRMDGSGCDGWWQAVAEDPVPKCEPGRCPGPLRRQVQHGPALGLGDPGGHVDDGAAQCRTAGHGLGGTGHRAGSTEQVVGDRRAQCPGTVGGEPA